MCIARLDSRSLQLRKTFIFKHQGTRFPLPPDAQTYVEDVLRSLLVVSASGLLTRKFLFVFKRLVLRLFGDVSADAVMRNLADFSIELIPMPWNEFGGWPWFKRAVLGVDEEESGLWAFLRSITLGVEEDAGIWRLRTLRRNLLGIDSDLDCQLLSIGVSVVKEGEHEPEAAAPTQEGWGNAVRYFADFVIETQCSVLSWTWLKRILFGFDEEEGTGLWRLTKMFVFGVPDHVKGIYTLQLHDQYPVIVDQSATWSQLQFLFLGIKT